ncbi:hypothetical protein C1645_862620, partial [Glomus cerebriforme]
TQRAEKIYKLLEKIGLDKIQYIKSYSVNEISKFTNDEILKIMDHFSNKPSTDFSEDRDNFINDDSSSQTDTSEVKANPLVSAEVSESTAPFPLTHDSVPDGPSNSFDDSKEVSPSNSLEAEDDYYKMLLEDCAKDCDSAPQSVKETNEEVVSQSGGKSNKIKSDNDSDSSDSEEKIPDDSDDDGYNGYGRYNEYGECNRDFIAKSPSFKTFRVEIVPISKENYQKRGEFSGSKDSLLRPQQENLCYEWGYFLQVEPTVWFEYLCHKFDKKMATKKARKYVDKIRNNNIPPLPPSASLEVSIPSYTYCAWHADCLFLKNDDDKNSSSLTPPPLTPSPIRGKGRKHSNHKKQISLTEKTKDIKDKNDKNNSSPPSTPSLRRDRDKKKDGWIAVSQQDDVREILICPHPAPGHETLKMPEGYQPTNHKNNRELIIDNGFWTWVLDYFLSTYLIKDICDDTGAFPVELFCSKFWFLGGSGG